MLAKKKTRKNYRSNTAESIEAAGNFLNNSKNPTLIMYIFTLIALCSVSYGVWLSDKNNIIELQKQTDVMRNDLSEKQKQTEMLNEILNILKIKFAIP
jgi:hypothetical protein